MLLDQLIFFPDRDVPPAPPDVEERWITTSDGVRLHAWYGAPAESDRDARLVARQRRQHRRARRRAAGARRRGARRLAYDYRGYGKSGGRPSEAGVYLDALAAYDDLRAAACRSSV